MLRSPSIRGFFLGWEAPFARVAEIVGVLFTLLILRRLIADSLWNFSAFLYVFFLIGWGIHIVLDRIRWYPGPKKREGIGVHFARLRVTFAYLGVSLSLLYFTLLKWPLLIIAIFWTLLTLIFDIALIYFHLRDDDPTPVNYFTLNKGLK